MITCPACGVVSHDLEFCDHCNADLSAPARSQPPAHCTLLPPGEQLTPDQQAQLGRPESCAVINTLEGLRRVHWIAEQDWPHWRPFVDERLSYEISALPPCRRVEEKRDGYWIAAQTTNRRASPWTLVTRLSGPGRLQRLLAWLPKLIAAIEDLHQRNLVWLTFEPEEIEETGDGRLWLTNMDLAIYPAGSCPERLAARPMFAPPEVWRFQSNDIGPATDVFHLAAFSYYWLAGLLPRGFTGSGGLKAFDYRFPLLRLFVQDLPIGIASVLERGLAVEAKDRFSTPAEFFSSLEGASRQADERRTFTGSLHWDIGAHTRTGKAKNAVGMENEDSLVVQNFQDPPRALLAIADGVTTCDIGTGALASLLTCLVVESAFDGSCKQDDFVRKIGEACHKGSQTLLSWALEKGYREQLCAGKDLMGTTLTAAWLEGNSMSVANLGDSRVYLVRGDIVEQLTIDGDLASGLFAAGVAPNEIRELGLVAKSLRDCIGGCVLNAQGDLEILEEFCKPATSTWPLLPGDVIVLCTDGLVEEGAFLDPAALAEVIGQNPNLSAKELAIKLADAADAKQRLPSALEPEGFGDNITGIVVKILKA